MLYHVISHIGTLGNQVKSQLSWPGLPISVLIKLPLKQWTTTSRFGCNVHIYANRFEVHAIHLMILICNSTLNCFKLHCWFYPRSPMVQCPCTTNLLVWWLNVHFCWWNADLHRSLMVRDGPQRKSTGFQAVPAVKLTAAPSKCASARLRPVSLVHQQHNSVVVLPNGTWMYSL